MTNKTTFEDIKEELIKQKRPSEDIEQIQRLAGYLVGTTDKWNSSNLAELADRVVHDED